MYYIEVEKGVNIAVYDLNPCGKKTIFFVHGWPINHKMFEYQLNVLPNFGFRCISIDLRGFGNSSAPWDGYSYDRLSDDIYVIIKKLNLENITLVGFSMGGPIVIRYMSRHSGYKVDELGLWAAAAPSFTQRPNNPYGMSIEAVNKLISSFYYDRPQTLVDFGSMFFASQVTPSFMTWFNGLSLSSSSYATIKTAVSLRDEDVSSDFSSIKVPTGIFHGKLDQICPFPLALLMNKGIAGSVLYPFEHSGHGVFYDELALFNNRFIQFLNA